MLKSKYKTVRLIRTYRHPYLIKQQPGNSQLWGNYYFTEEPVEDYDFAVFLNFPDKPIKINCRKGGLWFIMQEPPVKRNQWYKNHFAQFDYTISQFKGTKRNIQKQAGLGWFTDLSYDQIVNNPIPQKNKVLSFITSNKRTLEGHNDRLLFLDRLRESDLQCDIFGRGINPIRSKDDALIDYKYHIAAENTRVEHYISEKLIDPILTGTLPFYYGCPNVIKYLPERCLINIDINKPAEVIETIKDAIKNDEWSKRINHIIEAQGVILNKLNLFPMLAELFDNISLGRMRKTSVLPQAKGRITDRLINKLKLR